MASPINASIMGLVLVVLAAVVGANASTGDEFAKSLDAEPASVLDSKILSELANHIYQEVHFDAYGKLVSLQHDDVRFAIHEELQSFRNTLSDAAHLRLNKEERVRAIQTKHKTECEKVQSNTVPLIERARELVVSEAASLSNTGKKVLAVVQICKVVLSEAGDKIYDSEASN